MIETTHQAILDIADRGGWSDYGPVLLITYWVDETGQAQALLDYLGRFASEAEASVRD